MTGSILGAPILRRSILRWSGRALLPGRFGLASSLLLAWGLRLASHSGLAGWRRSLFGCSFRRIFGLGTRCAFATAGGASLATSTRGTLFAAPAAARRAGCRRGWAL